MKRRVFRPLAAWLTSAVAALGSIVETTDRTAERSPDTQESSRALSVARRASSCLCAAVCKI